MTAEKQVSVHVNTIDGHVLATFPETFRYLKMSVEEARAFAKLIVDCADAIEKEAES